MDPRYGILFEPVRIGPVTAPNRFYQTPHALGMGYTRPQSAAAIRSVKAEGGWGVVCTEYCSIHPSSDETPFGFLTLWDDDDERLVAQTADVIHEHGSLAGIELWHGGSHANNRLTREPMIAPSEQSAKYLAPAHARAMDASDIRNFRHWQVEAAQRACRAGFDIVYVYAGHDYLPFQFLSQRTNRRTDEYGGCLENRARLLKEMILDTKDAVGDKCAVAVRLAVDELHGPSGITAEAEGREIIEMLAELPDLWDVNVAGSLGNDSRSSRFSEEGFQQDYVSFVKQVTTKPVVGVGRFTSPDFMVSQIKQGVLDLVGAARPSIADPFLPEKIRQGREDEIRECIGCNICRSANNEGVPLRCTQNPTMGEEWRRGWHPERIEAKSSDARILVVGAGPAGLEASLALARRGYAVALAEASRVLGGRVINEASLPGLGKWIRVRDYRQHMLSKLPNVEIYRESRLAADDIVEFAPDHVVLAVGSHWRRDGIGSTAESPSAIAADENIVTPDDIFAGTDVKGAIVIYDDDQYAMGGALAERFLQEGHAVTLVTPGLMISAWTLMTDEQFFIQKRLMTMGIKSVLGHTMENAAAGVLSVACIYTGETREVSYDTLVLVTGKTVDRRLRDALDATLGNAGSTKPPGVTSIGDCLVPSSIADAVFSGHRFAREFEQPILNRPVRRERPPLTIGATS